MIHEIYVLFVTSGLLPANLPCIRISLNKFHRRNWKRRRVFFYFAVRKSFQRANGESRPSQVHFPENRNGRLKREPVKAVISCGNYYLLTRTSMALSGEFESRFELYDSDRLDLIISAITNPTFLRVSES